ncbi:MAG: VOC family protein [Verrucomicrobiales bacterium]
MSRVPHPPPGRGSFDRWAHIGTDECYLALTATTAEKASADRPYTAYPGIQHLGWEVPDAEKIRERLLAAGLKESTVPNEHPHRKRVYFYDADGNDWEFVEYFSDNPSERNDYALPDNIILRVEDLFNHLV